MAKGVLLSAGKSLTMHIHNCQIECSIDSIVGILDINGNVIESKPLSIPKLSIGICILKLTGPVALQKFDADIPLMSSFVLRIGNQTIASGQVRKYKRYNKE